MTSSALVPLNGIGNLLICIARGEVPGYSTVNRFGLNNDLDTGPAESIWESGGMYAFPAAASTMLVSSTSVSDTAFGVGARTVSIKGLDVNYNPLEAVVILNGQTAVTTVAQFLRVQSISVLSTGSSAANVGTIYIGIGAVVAGVPATVYDLITPGNNQSQKIAWTVPAGHTAYLTDMHLSSSSSSINQTTLAFTRYRDPAEGGVFRRFGNLVLSGTTADIVFETFPTLAEKSDFDISATTTDVNVTFAAQAFFILINNDN